MRKEVYLCDNCERTIADGKCSACGNDVCSKCANRIGISLSYGGYGKIFNVKRLSFNQGKPETTVIICKNCYKTLFNEKILMENPKPLLERLIQIVKEHNVALKV